MRMNERENENAIEDSEEVRHPVSCAGLTLAGAARGLPEFVQIALVEGIPHQCPPIWFLFVLH